MAHLSIEKVLKGVYQTSLNELPPKIRHLVTFSEPVGLAPSEEYAVLFTREGEAVYGS